jgi:PadR family transcriptional regulator PadR
MGAAPQHLGQFEQLVLLAILHQDEDAYGVTIRREIETRTRRTVTVGALYTALDRLESKGLVTSTMSLPTQERGGRSKRFFKVTSAGQKALVRCRDTMTRMWSGLHPDLSRSR